MIKKIVKAILPKKIVRAIQMSNMLDQMKYAKDGLYTMHNCSFLNDDAFNRAYLAGKSTGSWGTHELQWRVHTILWGARHASKLEGDFVECGVNKGGMARAIIDYLGFERSGKKFYLFDTFEGFAVDLLLDSEKEKYAKGTPYSDSYAAVKETFREFSNVEIVKGAVPHTLNEVSIDKVAFLSIDMNCVQPEIAAMDFFWPKMAKGGVIILDDFAYTGFEGQNLAHTEWAKKNNIGILTLPTGQGLLVKP